MRIGFDARWYNGSGVGTYVAELLGALAKLDGDFELIAYEYPHRAIPVSNSKIRKVTVRSPRYSPAAQIEMAWRCRVDRVDIFHAPFYVVPLLATCPYVVTVHDLIPFIFRPYNWLHQFMVKAGYRIAVRRAARIIAVSQHTANDLQKILGVGTEKIAIIHNACSTMFSAISSPDEQGRLFSKYGIRSPYVLTLSAGNWRTKNLGTAVEALLRVRQMGGRFQAVIAGPTDGVRRCGVGVKGLDPVITGFVPQEDLPLLYRNATVFLMASKYEGFGLPVLEAMACGCAVVSSNAGSLNEIAGDGAVLVDSLDAADMADAVMRLLTDGKAREEARRSALSRANDFRWRKSAELTMKAYCDAVKGQVRPR